MVGGIFIWFAKSTFSKIISNSIDSNYKKQLLRIETRLKTILGHGQKY